ncbi:hypothetical protein [Mangrovimonas sp. YM274]|uniref:hypothetical protein n=1 Tax=Mangrovimonas sp. YM274 TaxID=3070660 RepID=UPI0027DCD91A|nr:hypothetical protein [Mangrovimonas sp. YM274]WMI70268.1 hypothetical protein RBH95_07915 [Mangrovimonas sp. YM274]
MSIDKNPRRSVFGYVGGSYNPLDYFELSVVGRLHVYTEEINKVWEYIETAKEMDSQRKLMKPGTVNPFVRIKFQWAARAARKCAIISFSTLYNVGFEAKGKIAKNDKIFRSKYLDKFVDIAFPISEDRIYYRELKDKALWLRNSLIGHVDGEAKDLQIGMSIASSNQVSMVAEDDILEEFDFTSLAKFSMKIKVVISDYLLGKIKLEE